MATQTAKRDPNRIPTLIGVDSISFTDSTNVAVDPSTHEMLVKASVSFTPSGTQDVNLTKVGGVAVALGQTTMSASIPVAIASDQGSLSTTVSNQVTVSLTRINSSSPVTAADLAIPAYGLGGILAVAPTAQFDDVATITLSENDFGSLRVSAKRNLYTTIRDAAGNERGVNINASNQLSTSVDNLALNGGAVSATTLRNVIVNDAGKTITSKGGSAASSGDNTLVVAGTNRLKVFAFSLSTNSTSSVTCIFQSGASGTELWRVVLQAPSGVSTGANLVVQPPAWLFATASATLLNLNLSAAQTVHWSVSYFDEA